MAACAKHFPGLGSAAVSTDDSPHVRGVVRAGDLRAVPGRDPRGRAVRDGLARLLPRARAAAARRSTPRAYRLLRSLGFEGVAITDSLNFVRAAPVERWAPRAVRAGADLLLFTHPDYARRAIEALVPLARRGELDEAAGAVLRFRATILGSMSRQLLNEHVDRFNHAVRTGEWDQMTSHFTDDAELRFAGVPVGPFEGRETIARAYREQPPDDEVRLLDSDQVGDETIAGYAWAAEPEKRSGRCGSRSVTGGSPVSSSLSTQIPESIVVKNQYALVYQTAISTVKSSAAGRRDHPHRVAPHLHDQHLGHVGAVEGAPGERVHEDAPLLALEAEPEDAVVGDRQRDQECQPARSSGVRD